MLKVEDLESGYGPMQVLWKVSLKVEEDSITALLGPNGVGKSTTLLTIFGSLRPWGGSVFYKERDITLVPTHRKVEMGITLVPEGRHLFGSLTVEHNLMMGAYTRRASNSVQEMKSLVFELFPILSERAQQRASTLSGGEQQMLTIARALMSRPEMLLLDEPSQGLAPKLVMTVFETIERIRSEMGLALLLVEQNMELTLEMAQYVYVMHEGTIKIQGRPDEVKDSQEIREAYLGI
jgi:branched-chain amino acid transport system ATP-binding protein